MGRGHGARRSGATAAAQRRCEATTKRGTPCAAFALPARPWCISHDPERAAQVAAARARGGTMAGKVRALEGRRSRLDTPARLLSFTSNVIHDVVEARLDPDVGRVALYGVHIARQLVELSDVAARLAALEQQLASGPGRRGRWSS